MAVTCQALIDIFFIRNSDFTNCDLQLKRTGDVVKGIRILPLSCDQIRPDLFYICPPDHPLCGKNLSEDIWVVCVAKERTLGWESFLVTSWDLGYVWNAMSDSYDALLRWEKEMELVVAKGDSLQRLLDMSAEIIELPIIVYDPSMKLLAYINEIMESNPYFKDILSKGYMLQDIFLPYQDSQIFEKLDEYGEALVDKNVLASGTYTTIRLIQSADCPLVYVFTIHRDVKAVNCRRGILNMLYEKIRSSLERESDLPLRQNSFYGYFLTDILRGNLKDPEDIMVRFRYNGVPAGNSYALLELHFLKDEKIPLGYFAYTINHSISGAYIFQYESVPYLILHLSTLNGSIELENKIKVIKPILSQFKCICFVSDCFESLEMLPSAYMQTTAVANLFRRGLVAKPSDMVLRHEECRLLHMLELSLEQAPVQVWCSPAMYKMKQDDEQRSLKYIELLRVYFEESCEVGKTADRLYMHRSNVTYHLGKIKEKYGLDTGNSMQWLDIILSLLLMDFSKKTD